MYSENVIVMHGDWQHIWELSSEIEKWPERLPHYRQVRLDSVSSDGLEKRAYMAAWRNILPVSWHTIQRLQPDANATQAKVFFQHVGGVTKGMEVVWNFEALGQDDYRVTIAHEWKPDWPVVGGLAARLIGELIVKNVAGKTLNRIRDLAAVKK